MENQFEANMNDDTPTTETASGVNPELQELITRRDTLIKWIEAGAGVAADRVLLDNLDKQILDLQK